MISPNRSIKDVSPEKALLWCEFNSQYDAAITPNLIVDGNMENASTTAYIVPAFGILTKDTTNPHSGTKCLRIAYQGNAVAYARQLVGLVVGTTYTIDAWLRGDGTRIPQITDAVNFVWTGTASTTWQHAVVTFVAAGTSINFYSGNMAPGGWIEVDDADLKLVSLLTDYNMESADTSAYTVPAFGVLTKDTTNPHSGTKCLRIAYQGNAIAYARQASKLVIGSKYIIDAWLRGDGTRIPEIRDDVNLIWAGTASTSWQHVIVTFVAAGTSINFYSGNMAPGGWIETDDVILIPYKRVCDNLGKHPLAPRYLTMGDGVTANTIPAQLVSRHGIALTGTQYVDTGIIDPFERTDRFTLFMAKSHTTHTGDIVALSSYDIAQNNSGFSLALSSTRNMAYIVNNGVNNLLRVGSDLLPYRVRQTHTAALTYNGTSDVTGAKLYFNAVADTITVSSNTLSATIKNGKSILLGAWHSGAAKVATFTGNIHFAAIFPWELTPQQVQYLDKLVRSRINKS